MSGKNASTPTSQSGTEYHLHTRAGDFPPHCLMVGDPGRAEMVALTYLTDAVRVDDGHRGYVLYVGKHEGLPVGVITTHMGCPNTGIALPEAVRSGGRRFIRVGSSSTLQKEPKIGDTAICTGAVRLEGTTLNWVPIGFPAVADYRVVSALVESAEILRLPHHTGIGVTTDDFNEGQGRPDTFMPLEDGDDPKGWIPPRLLAQHEELRRRGCLFYSMEEAALFVWCLTHSRSKYGYLMAGSVCAIYGNRVTGEFSETGVENATLIALKAIHLLSERYPV